MDEARRRSERAARQGEGGAWWVASLRAGAVSRADLELAAWCNDAAAREVLGESALVRLVDQLARGTHDGPAPSVEAWLRALERWGAPVLFRGLLVLVGPDLKLLEGPRGRDPGRRLRQAIEGWCERPDAAATAALVEAHRAARPVGSVDRLARWLLVVAGAGAGDGGDPRWLSPFPLLEGWNARGAEGEIRTALLALARRGASLAGAAVVPGRPCPAAPCPAGGPASEAVLRLDPAWLELAAWLGEPGARAQLGSGVFCRWPGEAGWPGTSGLDAAPSTETLLRSDVAAWLRELCRFGPFAELDAGLALGELAAARLAERGYGEKEARRLLDAARAGGAVGPDAGVPPARLLAEVGLVRGFPRYRELRLLGAVVEEVVHLAAGLSLEDGSWSQARRDALHATACAAFGSDLGAVVEVVRTSGLARLLRHA